MARLDLPFEPLRRDLYGPEELLDGFDPNDPQSFARTTDFLIYRHFVLNGRTRHKDYFAAMMQSVHDGSITGALQALVIERPRVAAIMGGHKLERRSKGYMAVARLSRLLSRQNVTVASGGGPGAMEATHLGALLSRQPVEALAEAAKRFPDDQVTLPSTEGLLRDDGTSDEGVVARLFAWFRCAVQVLRDVSEPERGHSIAIPTWHYGHEPFTPLATHIAKYFQNSIREDGLLAIATNGVVFAEGKAGTVQEIFQDAAQNYYQSFGCFSPMVLLGRRYWTEDYPALALLEHLFTWDIKAQRVDEKKKEIFDRHVIVTDDIERAAEFIGAFQPPQTALERLGG